MEPSKQCPYCYAANVSVAASCINCHAPLWIDASHKPLCGCGCWSSPFVLLAVKQGDAPAYYMLGYWHYSPDGWRNHYGLIEDGGLGLRVTHWMPLPEIPEK